MSSVAKHSIPLCMYGGQIFSHTETLQKSSLQTYQKAQRVCPRSVWVAFILAALKQAAYGFTWVCSFSWRGRMHSRLLRSIPLLRRPQESSSSLLAAQPLASPTNLPLTRRSWHQEPQGTRLLPWYHADLLLEACPAPSSQWRWSCLTLCPAQPVVSQITIHDGQIAVSKLILGFQPKKWYVTGIM